MDLLPSERAALTDLRAWLSTEFGTRLGPLILFGSRARSEGTEESDLDVLVVVADLTGAEAREIRYFAGDLLTKHDVLVSPLAMSTEHFEELRRRERRIVSEIERDGVPI